MSELSVQPEFFGKFVLLEKLATGGMAEVYLGKLPGAENVSKYFAIKRILPQFSQNHEFIEMFKEEAKIAVNLHHSNVVSIYEFGEFGGQFYIAMEFVEGRNLRQILNRLQKLNQRLSPDQIVYVVSEVAKGLDHAHRSVDGTTGRPLNITHRDMSPQNIMMSFEGEVKVVDFGIAKAESKIENTRAGTLKGKFGYMSPEQAEGIDVDFRTDIFSLGVVLWELIASERLFISNSEVNTLRKVRDCVIPSLRKIDPNIPQELERIVNKALARDRNLRYQSSSEFHRDLIRFMNRQFPDFTSQEFSTFIKTLFQKEREESRQKMMLYAKIVSPTANEKTEIVPDHTHTLTDTRSKDRKKDPKIHMQNLVPDDKVKSIDSISLDVNFRRKDYIKSTNRVPPEVTGLTSGTSTNLPLYGINTGYTATSRKAPLPTWPFAVVFLALTSAGWLYVARYQPETYAQIYTALSQKFASLASHFQKQGDSGNEQLSSHSPDIPSSPPQQTKVRVLMRSTPSGASIAVDGQKFEAHTPAEIEVPANKTIKIVLSKVGYSNFQTENIFTRDTDTLSATLEKANLAYVNIRVRPAQAYIYIDRKPVGRSPIDKYPVPADKSFEILAYDEVSGATDRQMFNFKAETTRDVELFLKRQNSRTKRNPGSSTQKN